METILGLFGLAVYVTCVVALAAGVTFLVVKISPSQAAKEQREHTGDAGS